LKKILGIEEVTDSGEFPNMERSLKHWGKAFDHKKAKETGNGVEIAFVLFVCSRKHEKRRLLKEHCPL